MTGAALPRPPLLLITDRRQLPPGRDLPATLRAARAAGLGWVSLREKDLTEAELGTLVTACRAALAGPPAARLTLHGAPETAAALGLDGVHLPAGAAVAQRVAAARRRLGPGALIGSSCHDAEAVVAAAAAGADYATLSPVFATASKPGYGPALGGAGLRGAAGPLPLLALGGVTAARLGDCLAAGAAGAAVMGEVMRSADPGARVAGLLRALRGARKRD